MKCIGLGLVLLVGSGLPMIASDSPSESHRQAATELLELMNVDTTMMAGASAITDAMIQQSAMLVPYRDVLLDWAGKFMTWETMRPKFEGIYTEAFTESELRDMIAFYRTPTGQKAIVLIPELMQRGVAVGTEVANEHMEELRQMVQQRATELEELTKTPK